MARLPPESATAGLFQRKACRPARASHRVAEWRTGSFLWRLPRTFAIQLAPATAKLKPVNSAPITLSYDLAAATNNDTTTSGGGFDGNGNAFAAEMLPSELSYNDVKFKLGAAATGSANAVIAKGQDIELASGHYNKIYLLAAATGGDQTAPFQIDGQMENLTIQDWSGFVGQWDTRVWRNEPKRDWGISANHASWPPPPNWPKEWEPSYPEDYVGLQPGFVKPASIGWYVSHHHTAAGLTEPYQYSYLFVNSITIPAGAKTLKLQDNDKIRIMAVSVAEDGPEVRPAQPLFDTLGSTEPEPATLH